MRTSGYTFIVNPNSKSGLGRKIWSRQVEPALKKQGIPYEVFFTKYRQHAVKISRKIGTYDTSILPYEDCCTVFTPRHPRLRPTLEELEAAEQSLDIESMVQAAVDGVERIQI